MNVYRVLIPSLIISNLIAFSLTGYLWVNHNETTTENLKIEEYTLNQNGRPDDCTWLLEHSISSEVLSKNQLYDLSFCRALWIKENDLTDEKSCALFDFFAADAKYDWQVETELGNHCKFTF